MKIFVCTFALSVLGVSTAWAEMPKITDKPGRKGIRFMTPNPVMEAGAFESYLSTLYGIAAQDKQPPEQMTAGTLEERRPDFQLIY